MNFDINKFTIKAQETIQSAIETAQNFNNQILEPEHLLAALVEEKGSVAESIIQKSGANSDRIRIKVTELLERLPKVSGAGIGNQQMS